MQSIAFWEITVTPLGIALYFGRISASETRSLYNLDVSVFSLSLCFCVSVSAPAPMDKVGIEAFPRNISELSSSRYRRLRKLELDGRVHWPGPSHRRANAAAWGLCSTLLQLQE
ncbi:hypothetical protein HO173_002109 [Letharia columbiana]|uniref:Uncharacterized protein n=1 Tax=Letharia columbiana TaxID=112416 RepID=A0A8H6G306_9LECA|nr:uncharacterized protein HO173_002109 [Letharia columbiana]KAF6239565.1 hypothetical protein HO173_002109 [Letharia columbiana]